MKALFELHGHTPVKDFSEQILNVLKILFINVVILLFPKLVKSIGQHIVDILDGYALVISH